MCDIGRQADGLVGIAGACSFHGRFVEYGPPPRDEASGSMVAMQKMPMPI
mgnify:CR=1 FL=1